MKAVITVVGKDSIGILAKVSAKCEEFNINILDVSQTIMQDIFCMIMICDIEKINSDFGTFSDSIKQIGKSMGMTIHAMHEDIFNSMHNI